MDEYTATDAYFVYGIALQEKDEELPDHVPLNNHKSISCYGIDFENSENFTGLILGVRLGKLGCLYSGAIPISGIAPSAEQIKEINEYLSLKGNEQIKDLVPDVYCVLKSERI